MPEEQHPTLKITAEEAVHKFFLREMLFFFVKKRSGVLLDGDFFFTAGDFSEYIAKVQFAQTIGNDINDENIKKNLDVLKDKFYKRDKHLRIKESPEPLLEFSERESRGNKTFTIKRCPTEYINNAIRYLDISLMLINEVNDRNRIENLELQREIESANSKSLFGQTQDHKLTFCNRTADGPLGSKEKAIFNILNGHFKEEVDYSDIYVAIKNLTKETIPVYERRGYVNDGIGELRKKLYEISGNPETIVTVEGRESIYKLVY